MKKILFSFAAVCVMAVILFSCKGSGPKSAAEKFLNGFYHMDFAAAKEVSTEETKKQLDSYEQMMGMMQQNAKEEAKKLKVDVKDPKVEGDNATVEYTVSNDPTATKTLKMVKQNGKWLAQWTKMDNMGGDTQNGGSTMPAEPMNGNDTMMAPPADGANAPVMDTAKH